MLQRLILKTADGDCEHRFGRLESKERTIGGLQGTMEQALNPADTPISRSHSTGVGPWEAEVSSSSVDTLGADQIAQPRSPKEVLKHEI